MQALFKHLALGTRFTYLNDEHQNVWVKINATTIAKWDEDKKIHGWTGQQICSFSDNDNLSVFVNVA